VNRSALRRPRERLGHVSAGAAEDERRKRSEKHLNRAEMARTAAWLLVTSNGSRRRLNRIVQFVSAAPARPNHSEYAPAWIALMATLARGRARLCR
jgi:hypothetical protein